MKVFDLHTHFTIETSAVSEDSTKIGFVVENKSTQEHLDAMDRLGITFSLVSCPTLKYLDDKDKCVAYCRQVNDAGAALVKEHPDRFGFAASLPLPFVEESIAELRRAYTELGAMAVGMCSNYNGMYLGDTALLPLFDAMNELGCVALLHPAAPLEYPKGPITGKILPMYEFITDTTRTLLDLFATGTLDSRPNVRLVIPHTGSCLPIAIDRFWGVLRSQGKNANLPLNQLYFDLACDAYPRAVPILLTLTDTNHICYGTDYPAIPEFVLKRHMDNTHNCPSFEGVLEDVLWNNAAKLFAR
ncbi:MAG: amidohydrolase [Agathobacter sp.]|nr:amidohydrolase [Agathobacter sp.]